MVIVFCDKCGKRVADHEVTEGLAMQAAENVWYCSACAPSGSTANKPTQTARPVTSAAGGGTTRARKGVTTVARKTDGAHHADSAKSTNWMVPALAGSGVALLAIGLIVASGKRKAPEVPAEKPVSTVAVAQEKPRETGTVKTPPNPPVQQPPAQPTVTLTRQNPPPADTKTPDTKTPDPKASDAPLSQAERQKLVEKEMEDYREHRAKTLLEEAQAFAKQNAADPWSYQNKLNDIVKSYASSSSAAEARKLIDQLGNLPPPPDRLEMATTEAKEYTLVYDLDIATVAQEFKYGVDNRAQIKAFDRIAYFLELQSGGEVQYLYVSMDAFTTEVGKIGVPTFGSGGKFQQNVTNLNVYSNVKSIVTGTAIAGGNIEFWPNNYGPHNAKGVANAANDKFDWGDDIAGDGNYGCMQVHNHDAKQVLFAFNKWSAGGGACDVGIGNGSANPDWTFSGNGGGYKLKRLRVLVHQK